MGSTITTAKKAAAFKSKQGVTIYVLYEESYSKNVIPHTPKWSCISIGPLEEAMKSIFYQAGACEGGSLRNRSGDIKPENYIAAWLTEMQSPAVQEDTTISMSIGGHWDATFSPANRERLFAVLSAYKRQDLTQAFERDGQAHISLHDDVELLMSILDELQMYPCAVVRGMNNVLGMRAPADQRYNPPAAKSFSLMTDKFLQLDDYNYLKEETNRSFKMAGWAYSIVQDFIRDLYVFELREPGSFRKRIRAYRECVIGCPRVPPGTLLRVEKDLVDPTRSSAGRLERFVKCVPLLDHKDAFEVTYPIAEPFDREVCWLPHEAMVWSLPMIEVDTTNMRGDEPAQFSLF